MVFRIQSQAVGLILFCSIVTLCIAHDISRRAACPSSRRYRCRTGARICVQALLYCPPCKPSGFANFNCSDGSCAINKAYCPADSGSGNGDSTGGGSSMNSAIYYIGGSGGGGSLLFCCCFFVCCYSICGKQRGNRRGFVQNRNFGQPQPVHGVAMPPPVLYNEQHVNINYGHTFPDAGLPPSYEEVTKNPQAPPPPYVSVAHDHGGSTALHMDAGSTSVHMDAGSPSQ